SPPATSQLDWLISTTAMIVLSWCKATRDLLKACPGEGRGRSAGASGHSISWLQRRWCHLLAACPIPSLSWREVDSKHRFLVRRSRFLSRKANCGGSNGGGLLNLFLCGVPMVRIHLPPADSLSLSRSSFRRSRTRLSARVWAAGLATGSAETRRVFRYRGNRRQYLCRAIFQYRGAAGRGAGLNAR